MCSVHTCMKLGKLETQTLEKYKNVADANSLKSDLTFAFGLCSAAYMPSWPDSDVDFDINLPPSTLQHHILQMIVTINCK